MYFFFFFFLLLDRITFSKKVYGIFFSLENLTKDNFCFPPLNDKEKSFIYRSVFVVSANIFPADRFTYYLLIFFLDWLQSTILNVFETKSMRKKKQKNDCLFHVSLLCAFFVSSYYFTGWLHIHLLIFLFRLTEADHQHQQLRKLDCPYPGI